jgi:hypothetical protein
MQGLFQGIILDGWFFGGSRFHGSLSSDSRTVPPAIPSDPLYTGLVCLLDCVELSDRFTERTGNRGSCVVTAVLAACCTV